MRLLLTPNGTYGDLHPYLGIAEESRRRGHQVTFLCNPFYADLVNGSGFELVPVGTVAELQEYWHHPDMWSRLRYWKLGLDYCALRPMRALYAAIRERYRPGDTVVAGPGWSFGARIAQEKLGVPYATVHLEPFWIRSLCRTAVMPPPMITRDYVPRISKRCQFWISDVLFTDRYLAGPANRFRAELGLPPAKRFLKSWWHSPQRVIGLFPDWFFPPQPDWPPQTRLTGFPIWDRGHLGEVPQEVADFLGNGPPPVVFTPGTGNQQASRFFAVGAEACRLTGRRGILLTDYPQQLPARLPAGAKHFRYVPFTYLLRRVAVMVHHAGTGTAALCMSAGVPQVVMPMAYDQPDFADCLSRLGVAIVIPPRRFTPRRLAGAIDEATRSPFMAEKCRLAAEKMRAGRAVEQTVDLLAELAGGDGQGQILL